MKKNKKLLSILLCTSALGVAGILSHSVQAAGKSDSSQTVAQAPVTQIKVKVTGGLTNDKKVASATDIYFNLPADVNSSNYSAVSKFLNQTFTDSGLNLQLKVANFQKIDGGYAINLFGADRGKFDQIVKLNQKEAVAEAKPAKDLTTEFKRVTVVLSVKNRLWKYYLTMVLNSKASVNEVKAELKKKGITGVQLLKSDRDRNHDEVYVASSLYGDKSIEALDRALALGDLIEDENKVSTTSMRFEIICDKSKDKKPKQVTLNLPNEINRKRLTTDKFKDQLREYFIAKYFYQGYVSPSCLNFELLKDKTKVILSGKAVESFDRINNHFLPANLRRNDRIVAKGKEIGSGMESKIYERVNEVVQVSKKGMTNHDEEMMIGIDQLKELKAQEQKLKNREQELNVQEQQLKDQEQELKNREQELKDKEKEQVKLPQETPRQRTPITTRMMRGKQRNVSRKLPVKTEADRDREEIEKKRKEIDGEKKKIAINRAEIVSGKKRIARNRAEIDKKRLAEIRKDVEKRANRNLMLEQLFVRHSPVIANEQLVLTRKVSEQNSASTLKAPKQNSASTLKAPEQNPASTSEAPKQNSASTLKAPEQNPAPTSEEAGSDSKAPQKQTPPREVIFAKLMRKGECDAYNAFFKNHQINGKIVELTPKMILDIFLGMKTISENGVVHLDIKPENLMLVKDQKTEELRIFYIDFGSSCYQGDQTYIAGTPIFTAPEMDEAWYNGDMIIANSKMDIYSLGVTLISILLNDPEYMVAGMKPQDIDNSETVCTDGRDKDGIIAKNQIEAIKRLRKWYFNPILVNLLEKMVNFDPAKRPTPEECFEEAKKITSIRYPRMLMPTDFNVEEPNVGNTSIADLAKFTLGREEGDSIVDVEKVVILNEDGSVFIEVKADNLDQTLAQLGISLKKGQNIIACPKHLNN